MDSANTSRTNSLAATAHSHHVIYPPELLHTFLYSGLHTINTPDINRPETQNLSARPRRSYVLGHFLRLLDISPNDAGISAEMDHGSDLGATDGASATRAKHDLIF